MSSGREDHTKREKKQVSFFSLSIKFHRKVMVVVLTDIIGWYDTYDDINGFVQVDNYTILV